MFPRPTAGRGSRRPGRGPRSLGPPHVPLSPKVGRRRDRLGDAYALKSSVNPQSFVTVLASAILITPGDGCVKYLSTKCGENPRGALVRGRIRAARSVDSGRTPSR